MDAPKNLPDPDKDGAQQPSEQPTHTDRVHPQATSEPAPSQVSNPSWFIYVWLIITIIHHAARGNLETGLDD